MTATGSLILFMPFGLNKHTCDCGLTNLCYYLLPLHFLLGAVVGVVRCVAGGDGGSLLGLFLIKSQAAGSAGSATYGSSTVAQQ
jgi:hypothetical protein